MSSTIAVEELRVGMFVMLDGGWLSHPFPLSNFRIDGVDQLEAIRALGLRHVRWSPEKSELDEPEAPAASGPVEAAAADTETATSQTAARRQALTEAEAQRQRRRRLQAQLEAGQRCERQHVEAARAWREAMDRVLAQPRQLKRSQLVYARGLDSVQRAGAGVGVHGFGAPPWKQQCNTQN